MGLISGSGPSAARVQGRTSRRGSDSSKASVLRSPKSAGAKSSAPSRAQATAARVSSRAAGGGGRGGAWGPTVFREHRARRRPSSRMIRCCSMPSTRGTHVDAPPLTDGTAPGPLAALREGGRPLLLVLGVALAFKLLVAVAALDSDPHARQPTSDALYYLERARGLAGLADDPRAGQTYHLPPLYPWVLRLVPGALQGEYLGVMALQALAGTALLACTWLL